MTFFRGRRGLEEPLRLGVGLVLVPEQDLVAVDLAHLAGSGLPIRVCDHLEHHVVTLFKGGGDRSVEAIEVDVAIVQLAADEAPLSVPVPPP